VQSLVKTVLKTVAKMDTRDVNMFVYPIAPAESIKKISVPCFFIHCKQDQRVSVPSIKAIYDGAGSTYKMLWLTNGRWHFDSYFYNPEKYTSLVRSFVEKISNGNIDQMERQKIMEDAPDSSGNVRG
jgi:esterase/lipase